MTKATPTLYGIKNCDSVKKARKWLDEKKVGYHFHDFRVDGLDREIIERWLSLSPGKKLVNTRSTTWKQLDQSTRATISELLNLKEDLGALSKKQQSEIVKLLNDNATLVKRPVLELHGKKEPTLLIGFEPDSFQHAVQTP